MWPAYEGRPTNLRYVRTFAGIMLGVDNGMNRDEAARLAASIRGNSRHLVEVTQDGSVTNPSAA